MNPTPFDRALEEAIETRYPDAATASVSSPNFIAIRAKAIEDYTSGALMARAFTQGEIILGYRHTIERLEAELAEAKAESNRWFFKCSDAVTAITGMGNLRAMYDMVLEERDRLSKELAVRVQERDEWQEHAKLKFDECKELRAKLTKLLDCAEQVERERDELRVSQEHWQKRAMVLGGEKQELLDDIDELRAKNKELQLAVVETESDWRARGDGWKARAERAEDNCAYKDKAYREKLDLYNAEVNAIDEKNITLRTHAEALAAALENYCRANSVATEGQREGSCYDQFNKALKAWREFSRGEK